MFLLAIIAGVPCFTHFVFYSCLFTLENGIKMISSLLITTSLYVGYIHIHINISVIHSPVRLKV